MTPEQLARMFYDTYERLAPLYGYATREESAVPWDQVPEKNRQLMIAVATEVMDQLEPIKLRTLVHRLVPPNWKQRERRRDLRNAYEEAEKLLGCG